MPGPQCTGGTAAEARRRRPLRGFAARRAVRSTPACHDRPSESGPALRSAAGSPPGASVKALWTPGRTCQCSSWPGSLFSRRGCCCADPGPQFRASGQAVTKDIRVTSVSFRTFSRKYVRRDSWNYFFCGGTILYFFKLQLYRYRAGIQSCPCHGRPAALGFGGRR